jgi:hypothetical protein
MVEDGTLRFCSKNKMMERSVARLRFFSMFRRLVKR